MSHNPLHIANRGNGDPQIGRIELETYGVNKRDCERHRELQKQMQRAEKAEAELAVAKLRIYELEIRLSRAEKENIRHKETVKEIFRIYKIPNNEFTFDHEQMRDIPQITSND